ncbi:acyltransferase [Ramlibacter sp.]|uniref:acyltransferase family protein n=1 Tax=Ramlibacter sp. TaxID=1917967 RepID=UPI002BAB20FA|nr:acyltransferase [Ramlibacter sp.]HWI81256.1 acyltransferase [Ramlibacter sp.]
MNAGSQRVLGWDVLRGLCALSVAVYHVLYWQDVAALHTLGSYGVYLFFVLSGASLAYNYQGRLAGSGDALRFLATRWLRLAPLFLAACGLFLSLLAWRNGAWADRLPLRLALNASFAFGGYDPVVWALPVGGWSLGIEFVYYLAFPLLLALLPRRAWWLTAFVALALLQWFWIGRTAGSADGYAASAVAYHQVPAFAAYFFGGCVIGAARRARDLAWSASAGAVVWLGTAALLLALNPVAAGDELMGWRGAILFLACFAAVFASGQVQVGPRLAPVARWLGDITYGCYLLHPLFFWGFAWMVWPRLAQAELSAASGLARAAVFAGVLVATCATAWASERWFEAPVRRWGKRVLGRRRASGAPHIEAASISS